MVKKETTIPMLLDIILEAIDSLEEFTKNVTLEEFKVDKKTYLACERNLEIIGDSCNEISKRKENEHFKLTKDFIEISSEAYRFRNALAHGYDGKDLDIIFSTIRNDIPILNRIILKLKENNNV